jgi:hypothetical protein
VLPDFNGGGLSAPGLFFLHAEAQRRGVNEPRRSEGHEGRRKRS